MAKHSLREEAIEDLNGIWFYTLDTWSEAQAKKYYAMIKIACAKIAENPSMGKHYAGIRKGLLGYRVNKHIIFYKIISDNEIEVVRILHGQMDLENRMDEL